MASPYATHPGNEELARLANSGMHVKQMAKRYQVHHETMRHWLRKLGLRGDGRGHCIEPCHAAAAKQPTAAQKPKAQNPAHTFPTTTITTDTGENITLPRISMHVAMLEQRARQAAMMEV
ncbi:hypothetical protein [Allorhizobium undicola]|uniref:hypothetical protein n=1 Tax=Allorhizobium undicola TaxID=78527 RepID=UPI000487E993|nr:hypothetical protein [Allorhizobium undicola]